jgi:signal transduction histidine kinase/DNA-binding NarL/FixJ family response regulator
MENKSKKIFKLERQDRQLALVLLTALLLTLLAQITTLGTLHELDQANSEMMDVYDGTGHLQGLDRNLIELVHAQSNFIKTKQVKYVQQAQAAMQGIQKDMQGVRQFFQNELTYGQLKKLEELVDKKIAFHDRLMEGYQEGGEENVSLSADLDYSVELRDSILLLTDALRRFHRSHMLNSIDKKNSLSKRLKWVSFAGVGLVLLIAVFSIYYLLRTASRRQQLMNNLIEAKEKAEKAAFLKEQFIANMSHEIRTPLNAITGFSNLLQRTALQPRQSEFVHSIRTSSENLLSIVNDILDFSKIEAGALRIEKTPFNLPALIHSIENMFLYRAKEKHLQFSTAITEDVPGELVGDPIRLTQILANLLGNAFKFTDEGGVKLLVDSQAIDAKKISLSFTIEDTGIGIPEDKLTNIFDRFQQVASDTTRKYGGAGLGLTITKQLVEAQQGTIQVESEPGKRTAFKVTIPYDLSNEKEHGILSDTHAPQLHDEDICILIVEDNPMNQRVTELLLSEWGYRCDHAANGRIAVDMLREKSYDLVLMDIQMPEMDGYTAARQIRQELSLDVPIIATTAHAFAGEREKCIGYGMNDYISKPIQEGELLKLIRRYVLPKKEDSLPAQQSQKDVLEGFDDQYVRDISKGKPEVVREMISLFINQSGKEMEGMRKALQSNTYKEAAAKAHSMKSTVNYMGFGGLFKDVLNKFELEAKRDQPDASKLEECLEELTIRREKAMTFLKKDRLT